MTHYVQSDYEFEWSKDFTIRCKLGARYVEFAFDLDGGERGIGIEKQPVERSLGVEDDFVRQSKSALLDYLKGLNYEVVERDY